MIVPLSNKKSPQEIAKELIEANVTIEKYEELQKRRRERLETWNSHGVKDLIEREQQLIDLGEKVLACMREYKQSQ